MAHRSNRQEIVLVALTVRYSRLKQLTACFPRCTNNRIFSACLHNVLNNLFAHHCVVVFILNLRSICESSFADNKGHILTLYQNLFESFHSLSNFIIGGFLTNNESSYVHILQQLNSHFTLVNVLWLIVNTRLSAPAHDEDYWNCIDLIIEKRSDRVDNISFAAVLHIDHGDFTGCQMIPSSQSSAVTLIGSNNMMMRVDAISVHQIIAQGLQLAVRHSCIEIRTYNLYKFFNLHNLPQNMVIKSVYCFHCELNRMILESHRIYARLQFFILFRCCCWNFKLQLIEYLD